MSNMIRLSKSCLGEDEKKAVMKVLDSEFLGMGIEVERFEKGLKLFFNRPVACVVNGTAALQLALQACGIGSGDEILVASLTYIASFQAISATGAEPVCCDVDPNTMVLDWNDAERRITKNTKAIMPVHYSGGVGDLEGIYALAKRHNLRVIEDAAHAFGTIYNNQKIGSFGDIACFSFDGIKNITSGEGGCIVTNDLDVLQNVQDYRLLGVKKDTEMRYSKQRSWDFDVTTQGWRYHMSNIMAAIGVEQLHKFETIAKKRQSLAILYDDLLKNNKYIKKIKHNYSKVVPHIYVIILKSYEIREEIRKKLKEKEIQTGIHYKPNHLLTLYTIQGLPSLPVTEEIYNTVLTLPLHPDLSKDDINYICNVIQDVLDD